MASTDARPVPRKNAAYRVYFPILDADGDLVTGAAGLDSEVSIDGAAFSDCTNEATEIGSSGTYYLDLTSGEMNGDAVVVVVKTSTSGAKTTPIFFYPEEIGDFRVNVEQFGGSNGTFSGGRPEVNTTHAAGTAWNSGAIGASTLAADTITAAKIAADAITAAKVAADVSAEIADAVWDEDIVAAHNTADSAGKLLNDTKAAVDTEIAAIKAKTDNLPADPADASDIAAAFTTVNTKLDAIDDYIDTEVAAIKAVTDQFVFTTAGQVDATAITVSDKTGYRLSATGVDDVWDEATAGHAGVGTTGKALTDTLAAVDTEVAAIKAKTDNLPSDPADASDVAAAIAALDAKIDIINTNVDDIETLLGSTDADVSAIKANTDKLTFNASNEVAADMQSINNTPVNGDGSGTPWGP